MAAPPESEWCDTDRARFKRIRWQKANRRFKRRVQVESCFLDRKGSASESLNSNFRLASKGNRRLKESNPRTPVGTPIPLRCANGKAPPPKRRTRQSIDGSRPRQMHPAAATQADPTSGSATLGEPEQDRVTRFLVTAARARCACARSAAFPSRIAIPAIDRAIASRLKRHGRGLAAAGTDDRRSLSRSRTVTGTPSLVVLFGLTTRLTALRCRKTAFLKKRLICSGEGEVLPAVAASELNISGHGVPRVEIVRHFRAFSCKQSYSPCKSHFSSGDACGQNPFFGRVSPPRYSR